MAVMEPPLAWVDRILRAADHVHAHLDEELDPVALAAIAGFSLHHFHRVFRGMTGESVMGFVRRLRLERAAMRLKFGDAPVTDVALASGYGSHEAFTRAFHARFGVPPSAFRERERRVVDGTPRFALRDEPARVGFAVRRTGSYAECGAAWATLLGWAGPAGAAALELASLGLCYDDPEITARVRLRYDALLVVPEGAVARFAPPAEIVVRRVPAGRYAVALHEGPYDAIDDTYAALLGRWLPHRGLELADEPVVEVYLTSPLDTAPADLRTEVCVRIA